MLDPKARRALRVVIEGEEATDELVIDLMGKDPSARYRFIVQHAPRADGESLDV